MLLGTTTKVLDFRASAPRVGGRIVGDTLGSWGLERAVPVVQTCTSELVTEALRNGRPPLHLVLQRWTDGIQVIVIDGASEHGSRRDPGQYGESGVRMRIVSGLAASWGVESVPAGTASWFDVDTDRPSAMPGAT